MNSIPLAIQLDPDGWILKEVECLNSGNILPDIKNILVYPSYPNPFNPQTAFKYFVPVDFGEIQSSVRIFNLQGKLVKQINNGLVKPGLNQIEWNASGQSTGTYFIQLEANNQLFTQKIQLLK